MQQSRDARRQFEVNADRKANLDAVLPLFDEALGKTITQKESDIPWDCLALVGLTAANRPQYVGTLFNAATKTLDLSRARIYQRYIEALTKLSMVNGLVRTLNATMSIRKELKPGDVEEVQRQKPRAWESNNPQIEEAKDEYIEKSHGPKSWATKKASMERFTPDLAFLICDFEMKYLLPYNEVFDGKQTMCLLVVALIHSDSPVQAEWHMHGLLHHGGSGDELQEVTDFAIRLAQALELELLRPLIDAEKVISEHASWQDQFQ